MGDKLSLERGTPHRRDGRRSNRSGGRSPDSRDQKRGFPDWLGKYGPLTRTENRLIVENISSSVSWQDLKDHMRKAGDVIR